MIFLNFFILYFFPLSLSRGLAKGFIFSIFLIFSFFRRRYAHSTFDLRGVGCRPPLLLQKKKKKTLYACWQPGSKGCKQKKNISGLFYSLLVSLSTYSYTTRKRRKTTRTHTYSSLLFKIKKCSFLFLRRRKTN